MIKRGAILMKFVDRNGNEITAGMYLRFAYVEPVSHRVAPCGDFSGEVERVPENSSCGQISGGFGEWLHREKKYLRRTALYFYNNQRIQLKTKLTSQELRSQCAA